MVRGCSDMFIVFLGLWLYSPKSVTFQTLMTPVACTYPLTLLYILLLLSQSDWCLHSNDILITFACVFVGLNLISLSMSAFSRMYCWCWRTCFQLTGGAQEEDEQERQRKNEEEEKRRRGEREMEVCWSWLDQIITSLKCYKRDFRAFELWKEFS